MMRTDHSSTDQGRIAALEADLAQALRPIRPRQDYVKRLREAIRLPQRGELALKLQDWETLLMFLGGVFSGAVVIVTIARAMFHLFGRRQMP